MRWHLADRLGDLAEPEPKRFSAELIPTLISLASDKEPGVRGSAAKALGRYGKLAAGATNVLADDIVLCPPEGTLGWNSALALGQIGEANPRVIEALIFALKHRGNSDYAREELCQCAATALGENGPPAADALPVLREQLEVVTDRACKKRNLCVRRAHHRSEGRWAT